MLLCFEERLSDSPFVERIWRTHSERAGMFTSMALSHWQMCIWTHEGRTNLTLRGPETKATSTYVPPDAEYLGIVFKIGTLMPHLPASHLVDRDLTLPDASSRSVWLDSAAWELPTYGNVDTFVDRLVHVGLLVREVSVEEALRGHRSDLSLRSVQRRFLHVTGLTHTAIRQIERARYATSLLKDGASILDTVDLAGYADQPHLTRSLKRLIGHTPAQLADRDSREQLSFLFKTQPFS
jgi:AraC-like DNA-binding protein